MKDSITGTRTFPQVSLPLIVRRGILLDIHIDCTRLVILYKMRVSNNYNEECMNGRYARRKTTTQHKEGWAGDVRTSAEAYSSARTVNGIEGTVTSTAESRPPQTRG